jgi:glycosyltransferase involved in cell wall biosynthesis
VGLAQVIVVAHNDLANLKRHLDSWLEQGYEPLVVHIANDGSTDDTALWLSGVVRSNFSYKNFSKQRPGKKESLGKALDQSEADYLILTDADCRSNSGQWVSKVIGQLQLDGADIFLGYGPIARETGFLNKLVRFETVLTALQYFTWTSVGKPYMGVGRNLAYSKEVAECFSEASDSSMASGDDDLFIQKMASKFKVTCSLSEETFMYSNGPSGWAEWLNQKSRHISTSTKYDTFTKLVLGAFGLSQLTWPLVVLSGFKYGLA